MNYTSVSGITIALTYMERRSIRRHRRKKLRHQYLSSGPELYPDNTESEAAGSGDMASILWKEVYDINFNPIGLGGLGGDAKQSLCACMINGKGCGPITHLFLCKCLVGGPGSGPASLLAYAKGKLRICYGTRILFARGGCIQPPLVDSGLF